MQKAGFRYIPYKVTDRNPKIKILITASTTNDSHSVCVSLQYLGEFHGMVLDTRY